MSLDPRKAVYVVIDDGKYVWVDQKRPRLSERDKIRPFWDDFESAEAAMDRIIAGNRITLYRIKKNKVESFRVRSLKDDPNAYTSRTQAQNRLEVLLKSLDYTITRGTISVFFKGQTYNITASDARFSRLYKACVSEDVAGILEQLHLSYKYKKVVQDGKIAGHKMPINLQNDLLVATYKIGDAKSLENFKKRLTSNPSKTAQKHLLEFLNYHGSCLLDDGRFLAYKYVRDDFHDCHTGKFDYSAGKTVTMDRNKVVEDPRIACAAGLHVGSWGYSGGHDVVMLCVMDPKDVVSVPEDYKHQKIRACRVHSVRQISVPVKERILPVSFLKK